MKPLQVKAPELPEPRIAFLANLSNGEVIVEGKGDWAWIDGQKSPWNRLVRYTVENKISITSLSLVLPDRRSMTLPPASKKARFRGYNNPKPEEIPLDFEVKRFLARDMDVGVKDQKAEIEGVQIAEFYTIAEAIYKDQVIQLWVNELDYNHSFVVMKKL